MVTRSTAAHQPSSSPCITCPPHWSAAMNGGGGLASSMRITSSLQQQALHEAHEMPATVSGTLDRLLPEVFTINSPLAFALLAQRHDGIATRHDADPCRARKPGILEDVQH